MKGSQGRGKETEELAKLYEKLEQDWHAMKQHSEDSRTAPRRFYYCHSPRDIMSELQKETSSEEEEEEDWNNAEEEILQERVKGKKLLSYDALQGTNEDGSYDSDVEDHQEEEYSSAGCARRCWCCCCSSSASSSASYCPFGDDYCEDCDEDVERVADMVAAMRFADAVGGFGNGRRRMFGDIWRWLAFAFLVVAMCVRFARSYGGRDDASEVFLVPT